MVYAHIIFMIQTAYCVRVQSIALVVNVLTIFVSIIKINVKININFLLFYALPAFVSSINQIIGNILTLVQITVL